MSHHIGRGVVVVVVLWENSHFWLSSEFCKSPIEPNAMHKYMLEFLEEWWKEEK
jgi:hypothetical protein